MTPTPDRESLLQSALDGGAEMSERELAAFARTLIADGDFAEDYLVSRRILADLAELQEEVPVPDIAGRVMARLPETLSSPVPAAPSLGGWLAAIAAGLASAAAMGFIFADAWGEWMNGGIDTTINAILAAPASMLSAWAPSSLAAPLAFARTQLWTAAGVLLALTLLAHGLVLGRTQSNPSGKDR